MRRINFRLLPVLFIIGILPLIVFTYVFPEPIYKDYSWFYAGRNASDSFLHTKVFWFSIITVIIVLKTIGELIKINISERNTVIPL